MLTVAREQVMAYRVAATMGEDVLDLGIQEYAPGSAQVALAVRGLDPSDLLTVWATRGAPHLHRRGDLPALVQALWPVSDGDAAARIASAQVPGAAALGISAVAVTADALREVVTSTMPRGEASAEVTRRVPAALTFDCRPCGARHVSGAVWQVAGLAGGVRVESRGRGAALGPIPDAPPRPARNRGIDRLILAYLRLLGPAGPGEVARYLGTNATELAEVWAALLPALAEVSVEGRRAWMPLDAVDALASAPAARGVLFLPPMDPLLQARDRDVLVPSKARQKELWRALGNPGALVVDGAIAGLWRAKAVGRKRVELTVTPFAPLAAAARKRLEEAAAVVARAREVPEATVLVAQ